MDQDLSSKNADDSNSNELTSTMGIVNSTPTAGGGDSIPSSSSDANNMDSQENNSNNANASISSTSDEVDKATVKRFSDIDKEADLFASEYNLSAISADKITENVDDIVTDLENLLGDSSNATKSDAKTEEVSTAPSTPATPQEVPKEDVSEEEEKEISNEKSEKIEVESKIEKESMEICGEETNEAVSTTKTSESSEATCSQQSKEQTIEENVEENTENVPESTEVAQITPESAEEVSTETLNDANETQVNEITTEGSSNEEIVKEIVTKGSLDEEKAEITTESTSNEETVKEITTESSLNKEKDQITTEGSSNEENVNEFTTESSLNEEKIVPDDNKQENVVQVDESIKEEKKPSEIDEIVDEPMKEEEKPSEIDEIVDKPMKKEEKPSEIDEIVDEPMKDGEKPSEIDEIVDKPMKKEETPSEIDEIVDEPMKEDEESSEIVDEPMKEEEKPSEIAEPIKEAKLSEINEIVDEKATNVPKIEEIPEEEPKTAILKVQEPETLMEVDEEEEEEPSKPNFVRPTEEIKESTVDIEPQVESSEEMVQEIEEPPVEEIEEQPVEEIKEMNYEDELLKAAQEASRHQHIKISENKPAETTNSSNLSNKMVENANQDEMDLIKAAQEFQDRQEKESHQEVVQTTGKITEERLSMENLSESQQINYQKPLNIVVDNIQATIKEAESTTVEDNLEAKESSDEDKQAEYSSKISGQSQELKLTIRKTKGEDSSSILKIYDPKEPVPDTIEISPSESETDVEEQLPKIVIRQTGQQGSPKIMSPLKITIKPIVKPDEQKSSPKLKIKPIVKPNEDEIPHHHSPKITIKPIPKPDEIIERSNSPKVTIKPLVKPPNVIESSISPKIKIKPIVKPPDEHVSSAPADEERIVLKITKSNTKQNDDTEKLAKIKVKFSMGGGHAHIVNETTENLTSDVSHTEDDDDEQQQHTAKKPKLELNTSNISSSESGTSEAAPTDDSQTNIEEVPVVQEVPVFTPRRRGRPRKVPLEVRRCVVEDEEPVVLQEEEQPVVVEDANRSTRPKRSCRGPSVRDTLGMKPRKPRERGRGRGRGRGGVSKSAEKREKKSQSKLKFIKEAALSAQVSAAFEQRTSTSGGGGGVLRTPEKHHNFLDNSCSSSLIPTTNSSHDESFGNSKDLSTRGNNSDVVMYEEETRMSADINSSRAQTPAKQVTTTMPMTTVMASDMTIDESQSSVQSTATTESAKVKKVNKMEIEPEGAVISADQLAEYCWGGGGPYMLQEQVAQFLGIKSFKRKYPGIQRRTVDMQERDFIRESGLASEHLCDLGLTAVNSADILDLMYSDFQNKYEEYCKHQRDRQTKDITNKQKALSLAASQEKNKLDIVQQAVESAAQWNHNFNRTRTEQRSACMDLQTFTINYPRGRKKLVVKPKIGHYPIALVPGQYTDYYKTFTPTELNNLPLNTMLYHPINIPNNEEDSQSDGSGTESDSSSSGSDSSDSESSDDDCNICSLSPGATGGSLKVEKKVFS